MLLTNISLREATTRLKLLVSRYQLVWGLGVLLLFLGAALAAQPNLETELPTTKSLPASPANDCPPDKASILLPTLPRPAEQKERSLIPGVSNWAPPTHREANPDEFKALLGYYGPFYNIKQLDTRVVVLSNTVYVRPRESWRATGLVRNQSCETVRITALTARLMGLGGEPLDVVTAVLPIHELRPGEPAPFVVETSVASADVTSVEWNVQYVPSETKSRDFKFQIYEAVQGWDESTYSLLGSVYNLGNTTATSTRVIAAWLDQDNRVIHVALPQVRLDLKQLRNTFDLDVGGFGDFVYTTNDTALVPLLAGARVVLWGSQ